MNNAMEIVKAQTIISINGHEYKAEIVQGTDDNRYYFEYKGNITWRKQVTEQ